MMVPTFVSAAGHKQPEDCVTDVLGEREYPKWPLVRKEDMPSGHKIRKVIPGPPNVRPVGYKGHEIEPGLPPAVYLEKDPT